MDKSTSSDKLPGVSCDAINCEFQRSGCCHADNIRVQSPEAMRKSETFCSTFHPKATM